MWSSIAKIGELTVAAARRLAAGILLTLLRLGVYRPAPQAPPHPWKPHPQRRKARLEALLHQAVGISIFTLLIAMTAGFAIALRDMSETRARNERLMLMEIAEENRTFCEKRGLASDSHEHFVCTLDLNEIRKKHQQRFTVPVGVF